MEPDIPWNAGNLGRTSLAAGAALHLVGPMGFDLDDRAVRRAGLDYWPRVDLRTWDSWTSFDATLADLGTPWFFSTEGERSLWDLDLTGPVVLLFGSEARGFRPELRRAHRDRLVRVPMIHRSVRSLNVSTAAAVVVYEALRQRVLASAPADHPSLR